MLRALLEKFGFPATMILVSALLYWLIVIEEQYKGMEWVFIPLGLAIATYFLTCVFAWRMSAGMREWLCTGTIVTALVGVVVMVFGCVVEAFLLPDHRHSILAYMLIVGLSITAVGIAGFIGDVAS